jgi:hypothetical protein
VEALNVVGACRGGELEVGVVGDTFDDEVEGEALAEPADLFKQDELSRRVGAGQQTLVRLNYVEDWLA